MIEMMGGTGDLSQWKKANDNTSAFHIVKCDYMTKLYPEARLPRAMLACLPDEHRSKYEDKV